MKIWAKIIVLICLFLGNCVGAESFKVLVLPVDLLNVCGNYYCFPEMSEIIADDVIKNFNSQGKILSPDLYAVRKKLSSDAKLKASAVNVLNKYKSSKSVDFTGLKLLSKAFDAKSVLLIDAEAVQQSTGRSVWEVLEISTAFEIYNIYKMEIDAVLTDNVNDIVMWSGKYKRSLADNESRFWAVSTAQAESQLEKLKFYSKDIVSKDIAQNIMLRFYPKVTKPVLPASDKTKQTDFITKPFANVRQQDENDYGEIQSETIFDF